MMLLLLCALPLCALLLCAAGDAPRGRCDSAKCYVLYLESTSSSGAAGRCQDTGGQLYDTTLWGSLPDLQLPQGHFWVAESKAADARCVAVAVASSRLLRSENRTCADALDGFVCQYTQTCRPVPVSEGEHVNYTTAVELQEPTRFLPGSLAVVSVPELPPVSKHICTGTQWMRAPWSCEVMSGGCEYECEHPDVCTCPPGQSLHHNGFTCTEDPCAMCAHECVGHGGERGCHCPEGFRLGSEGHCVDVDECSEDRTLCSGEGEACVNEDGSYSCGCQEDYDFVDGACVDASFCAECEHGCQAVQGALVCACKKGYRVHPQDPTKCEEFCSEQDCPAKCVGPGQCYCASGYIQDQRDQITVCTDIDECEVEAQCEHFCNNTFGGFSCECEEGFELQDGHHCVALEDILVLGQARPTPSSIQPTLLPSYVKTGSIMGITVFALLCAALLYYLLQRLLTYCTKVQFYSLKREMEIFTLQQVSTETYKKLSHDWQFRSECHAL